MGHVHREGLALKILLGGGLLALWAIAGGSPEAVAQQEPVAEIRGVVLDAADEQPVASARVGLVNVEGEQIREVTTNPEGLFAFRGIEPGTYTLRVDHLGYSDEPAEREVTVSGQERTVVELLVEPDAIELEPVRVQADVRGLRRGRDLFAERHARGKGVFLKREEVLADEPAYVTEALDGVEGLRTQGFLPRSVQEAGRAIRLPDGRYIVSGEGWGCMEVMIDEFPETSPPGGERAGPDLREIDPERSRQRAARQADPARGQEEPLNRDIRPEQVMGIEVYRSAEEVPDEHRTYVWGGPSETHPCGLVIVWTAAAW